MESIRYFLQTEFLNNSIQDYFISTFILLGLVIVMTATKQILVARFKRMAQKTAGDLDDLLVSIFESVGSVVFIVTALYISTLSLKMGETLRSMIKYSFVIVVTLRGIKVLQDATGFGIEKVYKRGRSNDPTAETAVRNLRIVVAWGLWILGTVFILDNLGINVSAVVAGLGIGGIAVAMASQAVLGDAFSAISIFVDKPFQIRDAIKVGDLVGTVEHIGIKTTRIRSIHGEQLIFSNSDLTSSRIQNFKRMNERRIVFEFGITYETPNELVKKVPELVRGIVNQVKGTRLDRVHLKSFGDFALIYEVVYYVLSPEYNDYMDKQQAINFALKETFERDGIEFAYPTERQIFDTSHPVKTS